MIRRHPTRRSLESWLDGRGSDRTARHVADCVRCTEIVDGSSALPNVARLALAGIVEPKPDLDRRMAQRAESRIRDRQTLTAFSELFGLGWMTTREWLEHTSGEEDPS